MADLEHQFKEDRALRDSARTLFLEELKHVRRETRPSAIGERIANRVGGKADDVADAAVDFAGSHAKTLAVAVIGAVAAAGLWFARGPIGDLLGIGNEEDAGTDGDETEEDQDE